MSNWIRIKNAGMWYKSGRGGVEYSTFAKTEETVDINLDRCSRVVHSNDHVFIFQDNVLVASCTEADYCDALMDGSCNDGRLQCKPPKIVEAAAMK